MQRRPGLRRCLRLGLADELADPLAVEILALVEEGHRHVEGIPHGDDVGAPWSMGIPSSGVWVLMNLRCRWAASWAYTVSRGVISQSSHGDSRESGSGQLGALEDEEGADHLDPGGTALRARADDDVARAEGEAEPTAAVLVG